MANAIEVVGNFVYNLTCQKDGAGQCVEKPSTVGNYLRGAATAYFLAITRTTPGLRVPLIFTAVSLLSSEHQPVVGK